MALFQLNVAIPDRPGSLGLLASAIGAAGETSVRSQLLSLKMAKAMTTSPLQYRVAMQQTFSMF